MMQKTLLAAADKTSPHALPFEAACELFHHDQTLDELQEMMKARPEALEEALRDMEATERKRLCTVAAVSRALARLERRGLMQRCGSFTYLKLTVNENRPPSDC